MIDEKILIEIIKDHKEKVGVGESDASALYRLAHDHIIDLVEALAIHTSTPSEWISVEDRLPTEGQNVLCYENGNYYIAFYENMDNVISWWDWVDFDRDDTWNEACPTHWMPLPEAPEMKGGE